MARLGKAHPPKRMIPALAGLVLLCGSSISWAISNIENQRPGPPKEGFSGAVELNFAGKTGDKEEKDYGVASKLTYRKSDNQFLIIASGEYGSTRNIKDSDEAFVHTRWSHRLSPQIASEAFLQWEEDEFSNLASRTLAGGGARFVVASEVDTFSLALGIGAFYEREKMDLVSYEDESEQWRVNAYASYTHVLNDKTTLASTVYVQPSAENSSDLRALTTFSLTVKMTGALALKVGYQAKHDSEPAQNLNATPPIDNSKTNTEYNTSLVYRF